MNNCPEPVQESRPCAGCASVPQAAPFLWHARRFSELKGTQDLSILWHFMFLKSLTTFWVTKDLEKCICNVKRHNPITESCSGHASAPQAAPFLWHAWRYSEIQRNTDYRD